MPTTYIEEDAGKSLQGGKKKRSYNTYVDGIDVASAERHGCMHSTSRAGCGFSADREGDFQLTAETRPAGRPGEKKTTTCRPFCTDNCRWQTG